MLWLPVLFGCGIIFYVNFSSGFLGNITPVSAVFFVSIFLGYLNRNSWRFLVFMAATLFFCGSFYTFFYEKIFITPHQIHGKIYVDGVGKISEIKKFYNQINHVEGLNLLISEPVVQQANSTKKIEKKSQKKQKLLAEKDAKTSQKPQKSAYEKRRKTIEKNFVNVADFQEMDRRFLDARNRYNADLKAEKKSLNLKKIWVTTNKNFTDFSVGDVVSLRMLLQPPRRPEFAGDFDPQLDAKIKKIFAHGFVAGEITTLEKARVSSLDDWFNLLRHKVRNRISHHLADDNATIAAAFLIGDQSSISKATADKIRLAGLSHLLSISGFHLALAGAILFALARFLLSRSEYLALHFDLKKIAAIFAIAATFFYLKLAGSPIPAQRAFVMILLASGALFVNEKINAKRALLTALLALLLLNPYAIFSLSLQLSFVAILVLISVHDEIFTATTTIKTRYVLLNFLRKFWRYFYGIILASLLIQLASLPFLMKSFRELALLGFVANIMAIPLTSFVIMPLGFLALLLIFTNSGLDGYPLALMGKAIELFVKIADFVANLDYSTMTSPQLSSTSLLIAVIGLLLICLHRGALRILGVIIFCCSFLSVKSSIKSSVIFDGEQKFFAIYDERGGLFFSKKLRPSKQREHWMRHFNETRFKTFIDLPREKNVKCDDKKCEIISGDQRILVLLQRNKIREICGKNFAEKSDTKRLVIVNLTRKYELPDCFDHNIKIIDNFEFLNSGTQKIYLDQLQ